MRCMAIDMETATIFAAGFANRIPSGALLLVSDQPMIPEGVKTEASDAQGQPPTSSSTTSRSASRRCG